VVNIIINNIIERDHGKKIGAAKIRAISTSKMTNKIINKKNRIEKGFRVMEFIFIPHSKDEFLLDHFFVMSEINMGTRIVIVAIVLVIRQYKNIKYIMSGHCYIGRLVDKRCMLK